MDELIATTVSFFLPIVTEAGVVVVVFSVVLWVLDHLDYVVNKS